MMSSRTPEAAHDVLAGRGFQPRFEPRLRALADVPVDEFVLKFQKPT
jgi:hypothetical protein